MDFAALAMLSSPLQAAGAILLKRYMPALIVAAMILGVLVGFALNKTLSPAAAKDVAANLSIITDVFLRLIRMVIAPLVFSTLVAGIAHMEDSASVGRVGLKALGWFMMASIVSLTIGLVMVQIIKPGLGVNLPQDAGAAADAAVNTAGFTLKDFVAHVVPSSIFDAMSRNEILQIVVFSVFVGCAITALKGQAPLLVTAAEQMAKVMLKVTG